jgi:hypothetical protein
VSMRPTIYGFKLESIKKLFGSDDNVAFEKINKSYRQAVSEIYCDELDELSQFSQKGEAIIRRAIMEGVPFAELDNEDDIHVLVADAIAHSAELKSPGNTTDWNMQAFRDLRCDLVDEIESDMISLLGIFEEGRPFFGKKINSTWSYYGYLTAKEARKLYIVLDELNDSDVSDNLGEFLFTLTDWLDGISSQNLDLYFYIS